MCLYVLAVVAPKNVIFEKNRFFDRLGAAGWMAGGLGLVQIRNLTQASSNFLFFMLFFKKFLGPTGNMGILIDGLGCTLTKRS